MCRDVNGWGRVGEELAVDGMLTAELPHGAWFFNHGNGLLDIFDPDPAGKISIRPLVFSQLMKSDHQIHEARSLRMHCMVAERYRETPSEVIQFGLENLRRWQEAGVDCDDFRIWEEILRNCPQSLPETLCDRGEEAVRLRQSSPFAGLIPEDIRRQVLASAS